MLLSDNYAQLDAYFEYNYFLFYATIIEITYYIALMKDYLN